MKIPKLKKTYIAIIVLAVLLLVFYVIVDQFFRVTNIIVTPLSRSDSEKIDSVIGLTSLYKKNMFLLTEEYVKRSIINTNPHIESLAVIKQYPSTLLISVRFYNTAAYLQVNGGYFLLAADGRVLEKSKTKNDSTIPSIKYYQQLDYYGFQSGDIISYKDIVTSLRLLIKSLDLGFIINNIDINGLSMIVLNSKDKRFIFTTEKDVSEQEYQFSAIIRKLRADEKDFKSLDLRFDKPVISL